MDSIERLIRLKTGQYHAILRQLYSDTGKGIFTDSSKLMKQASILNYQLQNLESLVGCL